LRVQPFQVPFAEQIARRSGNQPLGEHERVHAIGYDLGGGMARVRKGLLMTTSWA
jgi:hypothetical protein